MEKTGLCPVFRSIKAPVPYCDTSPCRWKVQSFEGALEGYENECVTAEEQIRVSSMRDDLSGQE